MARRRGTLDRDRGLLARMTGCDVPAGPAVRDPLRRAPPGARRRASVRDRDRRRAPGGAVLDVRQDRPGVRSRADRHRERGAGAARDHPAAVPHRRPADAAGRDRAHRHAQRVRHRPQPQARGRGRHPGPARPARAARARGRARPRALARRPPRRRRHDARQLLRDGRGLHHPLGLLLRRHVRRRVRRRRNDRDNSRHVVHGHPARLGRRVRDLVRPHPDALALPRVRGRPRRRHPDQVALEPGLGAGQDLGRDGPHPAAGHAHGRGPEPVLHHPRRGSRAASRTWSPTIPRSRPGWSSCAGSSASSRRSDWPGGVPRRHSRSHEGRQADARAAVRDVDRRDHARHEPRAEAVAERRDLLQADGVGPVSRERHRHRGHGQARRSRTRARRWTAASTSSATSG